MRQLEVVGVRVEMPSQAPILLLKEVGGSRYLPIWIGAPEAAAIANALEGVDPPRPLTHDLLATVLSTLGHKNLEGRITEMSDGTFFASLIIDGIEISARPSDVVALALRTEMTLWCPLELLDQVGIQMADDGAGQSEDSEDEVERFREVLDSIAPEDFEEADGEGDDPSADPR